MKNKSIMKHSILILASAVFFHIFVFIPSYGQWPETIIDENIAHAIAVDVADLDGDSKPDLIVTDLTNRKLTWYQNKYPGWIKSTIDNYRATFAYSGDMDGDDTLDVVATRYHEKEVVWYENDQLIWTKHIIDNSTTKWYDYLTVADLNNDEKPDVVTAVTAGYYNKIGDIAWYENDHPTWTKHIIDSVSNGTPTVTVADIDGDEIPDVVATMDKDNEIVWFKTEDSGLTWSKHFIDRNFVGAWNMDFYDIDGDGTLDVVATSRSGDDVVWYENHHPIWIKHIIDASLDGADVPFFSDVDGDDTIDVVVSGYYADEVVWYENNHPEWIKHMIVDNLDGANVIAVADLDDDGIKEVVVPASKSISLYKNPLSAVYIPDTAFLHALIEEGVDTNGDSLISYAEAEDLTRLDINGYTHLGITDITGIESFINIDTLICIYTEIISMNLSENTSLSSLNCSGNELNILDVSNNISLIDLDCSGNQLTSLDVSNNTYLSFLSCYFNQLSELDVTLNTALISLRCYHNTLSVLDVSFNKWLITLDCWDNQLTGLDLAQLDSLESLNCSGNPLISLDVSKNTSLSDLECSNNQLGSIDVSNNAVLEDFYCVGNQLTSLDVLSNPLLRGLSCEENQLTDLDLSNNTALRYLSCGSNQLSYLDISNNTNLFMQYNRGYGRLDISDMPTLNEVCVWVIPFPPTDSVVFVDTTGSPNVYFTKECTDYMAPHIVAIDTLYQPDYIEATSSEDGMIYLVPENSDKELETIRGLSLDSISALSNTPVSISLSGLENGVYWLYARDSTGNISEPEAITIMGVGMEYMLPGTFNIYPNPTFDLITIQTNGEWEYSIELINMSGQMIHYSRCVEGSHRIDLSSFRKGVYFITIRSAEFVTKRKVVKL